MPRLTPNDAAEKLVRRGKAATQDYEDGVNAVTESPTAKAADNIDYMLERLLEAFNDGRVEQGLRRVTLAQWKTATAAAKTKFSQGLEASKEKIRQFYVEFFAHLEGVEDHVKAMPHGGIEDSIARSEYAIRANYEFGRQRRRG